jgi:hypothetical protein
MKPMLGTLLHMIKKIECCSILIKTCLSHLSPVFLSLEAIIVDFDFCTQIRNQAQILAFFIPIFRWCNKQIFWPILALFANFGAKIARNGSKNEKTSVIHVS